MQRHLNLPDLVGNALCRQASTNCHHFNSQLGLTSKQNHSLIEGVHYLTDRVIHSLPEDARTITPAHPGRSVNTSASNTTLTHYKKFTNERPNYTCRTSYFNALQANPPCLPHAELTRLHHERSTTTRTHLPHNQSNKTYPPLHACTHFLHTACYSPPVNCMLKFNSPPWNASLFPGAV